MSEKSRDERQSAEYSAKTVAEALKRASEELGMPVEKLDYEVVKEGRHSLLGLMRTGEAVVRVWSPAPVSEVPMPQVAQPKPEELSTPASATHPEEEDAEFVGAVPSMKGNPPDLEKVACDVVSTLLDKMEVLGAAEVMDRGGKVDPTTNEVSPLVLNVVGDDLGALIGRRGETLRDLQFIARLIMSRKLGVWPNVVLDVENYKAKRVTALKALAVRMADQVRQTGRPMVMEPMPAHERRIVHLALRDNPDVYTESTGVDEERKVQILPKK
jgi:spoIIIJ-associated protein